MSFYVCQVASEQTTRLLEQCPLIREDQNGDVWQKCNGAAFSKKNEHGISAHASAGCRALVMIWARFAATAPGRLTAIRGTGEVICPAAGLNLGQRDNELRTSEPNG